MRFKTLPAFLDLYVSYDRCPPEAKFLKLYDSSEKRQTLILLKSQNVIFYEEVLT